MIKDSLLDISPEVARVLGKVIAPNDAYHAAHLRRVARTLDVTLETKPTGKLLELGTSAVVPLVLRQLLPELEVHVTEFDLTQEQVGTKHLALGGLEVACPVYRVNLETQPLPVADGLFDTVLCCEVLEHMELDPMFMLSEVNRVLKDGGALVLTTPNVTSSRGLHKMLRSLEPYFYMQYRRDASPYRHNYEYSVTTLRQVLKSAGFSGRIWSEDTFEDPMPDDVKRLRDAGYTVPDVGDNIFAVVKKTGGVRNRYPGQIYAD